MQSSSVHCLLGCLRQNFTRSLLLLCFPSGSVYWAPENGCLQPCYDITEGILANNEMTLLQDTVDIHILWWQYIHPAQIGSSSSYTCPAMQRVMITCMSSAYSLQCYTIMLSRLILAEAFDPTGLGVFYSRQLACSFNAIFCVS